MVTGTLGTWCRAPGYVLKCSPEELGLYKYQKRRVFLETVHPKTGCCGVHEAWWWRVRAGQMVSIHVAVIPAPGSLWHAVTGCHGLGSLGGTLES